VTAVPGIDGGTYVTPSGADGWASSMDGRGKSLSADAAGSTSCRLRRRQMKMESTMAIVTIIPMMITAIKPGANPPPEGICVDGLEGDAVAETTAEVVTEGWPAPLAAGLGTSSGRSGEGMRGE
jgi:hypothetical protein